MNKWLGSGRLTDNPVLKYDSDRAVFATFTIMCVRDGKIPDGGQAVDFIDCKCTGHNAEFAKNFLRKDKKVEIVGRLESGHYTEPGGRKIYTKTVRVYEINFAETKAEEDRPGKTNRFHRRRRKIVRLWTSRKGTGNSRSVNGRLKIQRFRLS